MENVADIVPVDLVANALIAAVAPVWRQDRLFIENCGTSTANPVQWSDLECTVSLCFANFERLLPTGTCTLPSSAS